MLSLNVKRRNNNNIETENSDATFFYDESITVELESQKICKLHLYVTVLGQLKDKEGDHSVVIYDEHLSQGTKWSPKIHVRHPRSPLHSPQLEIVATAHYTEEEVPAEEDHELGRSERLLDSFAPIPSTKSSFIVPFSNSRPSTANSAASAVTTPTSTAPSIGIATPKLRNEPDMLSPIAVNPQTNSTDQLSIPGNSTYLEHGEEATNEDGVAGGKIEVVRWKARLAQAIELEIRSLRPALERDRIIAEIDLVAGSYPLSIDVCDVRLEDGLAISMNTAELPIVLGAHEKYAMCYNLQLRAVAQLSAIPTSRKPLNLYLECEVLVGNKDAGGLNPQIITTWMPIVDFEGTQGPLPRTPALNLGVNSPIAPSFPTSKPPLNRGGSSTTLNLVSGVRQSSSSNLSLMGGISILITGPQFVKVGEVFEWNFKIINRSQRNRLFTITFNSTSYDPLRKDLLLPADPMVSISTYNSELLRRRATTHYRNIGADRGILPLCQELRVGNLSPHVCFETKIKLCALSKGTHTIDTARIEDLTNRDTYDVGSLLEVIVLPSTDH